MSKTRKILGANLTSLMNLSAEYGSAPAVERATLEKGCKVGRSTVQRVKDAATTVNLDYIEVFGKVFRVDPWRLLHPTMGQDAGNKRDESAPPFADALEMVLDALANAPDRDELRQLLPILVDTNATHYRARLLELLQKRETSDPQDRPPEILATHQAEIDARVKAAEELHEQQKHSRPTAKKRTS